MSGKKGLIELQSPCGNGSIFGSGVCSIYSSVLHNEDRDTVDPMKVWQVFEMIFKVETLQNQLLSCFYEK